MNCQTCTERKERIKRTIKALERGMNIMISGMMMIGGYLSFGFLFAVAPVVTPQAPWFPLILWWVGLSSLIWSYIYLEQVKKLGKK